MKAAAIAIVRNGPCLSQQQPEDSRRRTPTQSQRSSGLAAADWTEVEADITAAGSIVTEDTTAGSDTEMTTSGIVPPITS
jgi:hypothetical protein